MLILPHCAGAVDDGATGVYTYNFDYWGEIMDSPDAYRVQETVTSASLNLDIRMNSPQSLFAAGSTLYVVDTGNNRILQLERRNGTFELERIITTATAEAKDYQMAEEVHNKTDEYEKLIKQTEEKEKELSTLESELKALTEPSEDEASVVETEEDEQKNQEAIEQKRQAVEEARKQLEQLNAQTETAHHAAQEAEQTAREEGCKIWRYEVWKTDESGNVVSGLNNPNDISVDADGYLYIADTGNYRILKMDPELKLVSEFTKPLDSTFDQKKDFQPTKLVTDSTGRVFTLATSVNKGIIKFEADGEFTGFIGANKVTYNMWDYIWKNFFSTREQRAQMADFVPTEYKNLCMDPYGFIYATHVNFSEWDLLSDVAKPIRRLNLLGNDILIKNDRYPPIGDLYWMEGMTPNDYHGPSKLVDITVLEDDMYCAIDRTRGRIFGYDSQGIMLWAFGTRGSMEGASSNAVSIEHMGYDLITLDDLTGNITVFTPTEYGMLIYKANKLYLEGDYDGLAETWKEVLKMNVNYPPAHLGIGISLMQKEDYTGAMEEFKIAHNRENYGKAYRYYRQEWMEKNILWVALVIAALVILLTVRGVIRKSKWEVSEHDRSKAVKQH